MRLTTLLSACAIAVCPALVSAAISDPIRIESGLISGAVAYEPQPLEKPADGNLLICCSQPIDDVVVDL